MVKVYIHVDTGVLYLVDGEGTLFQLYTKVVGDDDNFPAIKLREVGSFSMSKLLDGSDDPVQQYEL